MSNSSGWLLAAAMACCTLLLLTGPQPTSGQGLSATSEQLGANAAATATEFDAFEDLLALSTTGGRGRGSRGGSGNLGTTFRQRRDFEQLQTSVYYIGGSTPVYNSWNTSQTPGGLNYVPQPREQGSCNSCVAQAVAAAVQMSLAYTTREPVDKFNVSAGALYYCVAGGRTCKTGWDIPAALRALEQTAQWMLPAKCFHAALEANPAGAAEPDVSDFKSVCRETAATSHVPECEAVTAQQPRYSCSFKSLSSFWQIQQHIRMYGSAITRIAVYDDFTVQFNESAKSKTAMELPPYRRNTTAKLQYGHAAVIVGYDNTDFTWTVLNSWGSGTDSNNARKTGGVTKDGMFRIRMGVAGVGTPDATYGVACEPALGSVDDTHSDQPWLRKTRLPLKPDEIEDGCYSYTMTASDTLASVAEHFGVDIRDLVRNNLQLFSIELDMTYKYQTTLTLSEMKDTLAVVQNVTQGMLGTTQKPENNAVAGAIEPYFVCYNFDSTGNFSPVTCDKATLELRPDNCTRNGTVACSLFYSDVNVTQPATGSSIRLCNPSYDDIAEFNAVAYEAGTGIYPRIPEKQEVALRKVLQLIDSNLTDIQASDYINCAKAELGTDWSVRRTIMTRSKVRFAWAIGCSKDTAGGDVVSLYFRVLSRDGVPSPSMHPHLDDSLVLALLDLPALTWLDICVYGGTVAPELGGLQLQYVSINHYCMDGTLPPNLLYGWPGLETLIITRQGDAVDYTDPEIGTCGISGPIPQQWRNKPRKGFNTTSLPGGLSYVDLSCNQLTGGLPAIIGGTNAKQNLTYLDLQRNRFTGRVPESWSWLKLKKVYLQQNQLAGPLPESLNKLEGKLQTLYLDGNAQLSGCVPLSPFTEISYDGTKVDGYCDAGSAQEDQHKQQRDAVVSYFVKSLDVDVEPDFRKVLRDVAAAINKTLGSSVQPGRDSKTFQQNHPLGEQRGFCRVVVTLGDNGVEYITSIEVGATDDQVAAAGLSMQPLVLLMQKLPGLEVFDCNNCNKASTGAANKTVVNRLPPKLPSIVPNLTRLALTGCGLIGTIPLSFGGSSTVWLQMEELLLDRNSLTGRLPPQLANLKQLKSLDLSSNKLESALPPAWSALPDRLYVGLEQNTNITGIIPPSYTNSTGTYFNLFNTTVRGCVPRGLIGNFKTLPPRPNDNSVTRELPRCG